MKTFAALLALSLATILMIFLSWVILGEGAPLMAMLCFVAAVVTSAWAFGEILAAHTYREKGGNE